MDGIENKISEILSDPNSMSEIMNIAKSLGFTDEAENVKNDNHNFSPDMLNAVTKLTPLINEAKKEDDSTRLLKALKPLLSAKRQEKVDSAIKIIGLLRLLPALKENSALSSIFSSIF